MQEKLPPTPATIELITYVWVLALSILGGVVSFYNKLKVGHTRVFNIMELMGEIGTSAFAGIITFYLCEWAEISPMLTAAFVGISGHMGSRAIFKMERWAENRFTPFQGE